MQSHDDSDQGNVENANVSGSLLQGDVSTQGGDLVGRDKNIGLNGEEVSKIIEVLLKHFPRTYLIRPEQLDQVLLDFRRCHEELHEWKELHNYLNEVLNKLSQFDTIVRSSKVNKVVPEINELRDRWRPIAEKLNSMLRWGSEIKYIGKRYEILNDGNRIGEEWAVRLGNLQGSLNEHLGIQGDESIQTHYPGRLQRYSFHLLGAQLPWWERLYDLTSNFSSVVTEQMTLADSNLRKTADELYQLSEKALASERS